MMVYFVKIHKILSALCLVLSLTTITFAENNNFVTNSSDIIEQLQSSSTEPAAQNKPQIRYRSFQSSATPEKPPTPQVTYRSITIIQHNSQNEVVEKLVKVAEKQTAPHVNLKIEFDSNSYSIRPESFSLLAELGKALSSNKLKSREFFINGHTDSDGSNQQNLNLSLNRAQSVKEFITSNYPVSASQLTIIGYGESMLIAPDLTSSDKQMNRRVEVVLKE